MPVWDQPAVDRLRRRLRLALDPRRRQGAGQRLGAGPGASLEFHDHRAYAAGDDLRHLDWRLLARSDQLLVRRYRKEVAPRVEVLLDCSLSMEVPSGKTALATGLAALLVLLGEQAGARARLWCLGERAQRLDPAGWRTALGGSMLAGQAGLEQNVPGLATGAERFLISDGLCPGGGAAVVHRLGRDCGRICLLQVLAQDEREPQPLGAVHLVGAEGGSRELLHDAACCAAYRERLARHQAGWERALSGRGAGLVPCPVEAGLDGAIKNLLRRGAVEAAT